MSKKTMKIEDIASYLEEAWEKESWEVLDQENMHLQDKLEKEFFVKALTKYDRAKRRGVMVELGYSNYEE